MSPKIKTIQPPPGNHLNLERGELVLSNLKEGVVVVELDKTITYANERAIVLLGEKDSRNIVGRKYTDVLVIENEAGEQIAETARPLAVAMAGNREVTVGVDTPVYLVTKQGQRLPVMINVTPLFDGTKVQGAVSLFHELKRRDDERADFISAASHQIRTPLAVANLHVDMLLGGYLGSLTPAQREAVEEISFYNQKMAAVLAEFLTASRIEMGTFNVVKRPTDLASKVELALRELAGDFMHKQITIIKDFEKNLPLVMTDPEVMRMVFHHLISNAIKYTDAGGEIRITLRKVRKQIQAAVSDTGSGIVKEEQGKIFDRLYGRINVQPGKTSKVSFGLYFVKSMLDLCESQINVKSQSGQGTCFTLKIPVA